VGNTIQLSQTRYGFAELSITNRQGFGVLKVDVLRGDATNAATVQYLTSDESGGLDKAADGLLNEEGGFASSPPFCYLEEESSFR
jgi:hypothetical protein